MIRLEDPAGAEAAGTIIDTGVGGADPVVWNDLSVAPFRLVREGHSGFNVAVTAAGVALTNVQPLAPSTVSWAHCGVTPIGFFMPDIDGHLYLTMHVTGHIGPTDNTNGDFTAWGIILQSRGGFADTSTHGCMGGFFSEKSAVAGHLGEQSAYLGHVSSAPGRTRRSQISDAVVPDEFEIEMRFRPAGVAGQDVSVIYSVIDWLQVRRWIGGVAQASLSDLNLALVNGERCCLYGWQGFHAFFGVFFGETSKTIQGTITQVGMSRGRFIPYI